MILWKYW